VERKEHNWDADDYEKNSSAQFQWAEELIAKLGLLGSESILDIGCGDGRISARLAAKVKHGSVVGIDLSESMIRHAIALFPSDRYPNLSFRLMDATEMDLPEKFDIAFSNAVLHWVRNHPAVLHGVRSCLKKGGRVLFQMGGRGNASGILEVLQGIQAHPKWRSYFEAFTAPYHFLGPEEYMGWLREAGFLPVRVDLIPKDMQHSLEGLIGWLRTTWFPYTDSLPIELRDLFLRELADAYCAKHPPDPGSLIHVKMVRLEVEATAV